MPRRWSLPTLSTALAVATTGAVLVAGGGAAHAQTVRSVQAQVRVAQARMAALNRSAEAAANGYDQARLDLAAADRSAAAAALDERAAEVRLTLAVRRVDAFAAAAYRSGGISDLTAVTSSNGPAQLVDELGDVSAVATTESDLVDAAAAARVRQVAAARLARARASAARAVTVRLARQRSRIRSDAGRLAAVLAGLRATELRLAASAAAAAERQAAALRARQLTAQQSVLRLAERQFGAPTQPPALGHGGAATAVAWAYRELGKPYVWGGAGPDGFDCSGLTMYVWAMAGVSLPHSSAAQWSAGPHVPTAELQPGDLLFFYPQVSHVGIYVGGGEFINALHAGTVVQLAPLAGYWASVLDGAVRP